MAESNDLQNELIFRSIRMPGELFDFAGQVLRTIFKRIFVLLAFPNLLGIAAFALYSSIALPYFFVSNKNTIADQAGEMLLFGLGGLIIFVAITCVLVAYASGVIIEASWDAINGGALSPGKWAETTSAKLPALIWVTIRAALAPFGYFLVGLALILGPGAIMGQDDSAGLGAITGLGILWLLAGIAVIPMLINKRALAPVILLREQASIKEAMKRSGVLTTKTPGTLSRGSFSYVGRDLLNNVWAIAILVVLAFTFIGIPALVSITGAKSFADGTGGLTKMLVTGIIAILPLFVSTMLLQLLWFCGSTVLYLDRIVQLEGYDVILLKQRASRSRSMRYEV